MIRNWVVGFIYLVAAADLYFIGMWIFIGTSDQSSSHEKMVDRYMRTMPFFDDPRTLTWTLIVLTMCAIGLVIGFDTNRWVRYLITPVLAIVFLWLLWSMM